MRRRTSSTDSGDDSDDANQAQQQSLALGIDGGLAGWSAGGAWAAWWMGAALPLPYVFFAVAGGPVQLSPETQGAADAFMPAAALGIPNTNFDAGAGADPFSLAQFAGTLPSGSLASSVPEVPLPAMVLIGFGGLALVRRRRLFVAPRLA